MCAVSSYLFFFNDTATTEIYTLSLHDALPIFVLFTDGASNGVPGTYDASGLAKSLRSWDFPKQAVDPDRDRKSTRLNSSHQIISYALLCLQKKKQPDAMPSRLEAQPSVPAPIP